MSSKNNRILKVMVEVMAYSSAAVFGPLAVFLILGYWFDKFFNSSPKFLLIGLAIAFIVTNILLFKKSQSISLSSLFLIKENNRKKEDQERKDEK